jgi:hypothetical protein
MQLLQPACFLTLLLLLLQVMHSLPYDAQQTDIPSISQEKEPSSAKPTSCTSTGSRPSGP